ncbi:hypothetical protein Tsubulata_027308, partial [Turnera subulata]
MDGIVNLKNLRYLLSNQLKDETYEEFNAKIGTRFPPKLDTLNNLKFLGCVEANSFVVKEIRSMTRLVLRIYHCYNLQSITVAEGVMPGLKEFVIDNCEMLKENRLVWIVPPFSTFPRLFTNTRHHRGGGQVETFPPHSLTQQ